MIDEAQHKRELLALHTRRMYELDRQLAVFGLGADPKLSIERQDLARQIADLDNELAALGQSGDPTDMAMTATRPSDQASAIIAATEARTTADRAQAEAQDAQRETSVLAERVDWLARFLVAAVVAGAVAYVVLLAAVVAILIKVF